MTDTNLRLSVTPLRVTTLAPVGWLRAGWRDLLATRGRGVFYGVMFCLMGYAIVWQYQSRWQWTMGLISGFFILGPFVCAGVYDLSRQRERGEAVSLWRSIVCWRTNLDSVALFAIALTFVMIVWARVSVILFALFSTTGFPTLAGVLGEIFAVDNLGFVLVWLLVGAGFATLAFAISVVSIPLMLDQGSDMVTAVFASVVALWRSPLALAIWAACIVLIIGGSLVFGFLPLLITAPWIGHATWHAYRALIARPGAS